MKIVPEILLKWFKEKYDMIPGIMEVYHTFGSDLKYHNHLHLLVSAGGLTTDYKELKKIDNNYLINADWLMSRVRWRFEKSLYLLLEKGFLKLPPEQDRWYFKKFIKDINKKGNWVGFVCPQALSDPLDIIAYIGRYTKRACISEYRIESVTQDSVTFTYKDYKAIKKGDIEIIKTVTLLWLKFFNRLFQHIPHKGFRIVRYYGIYNNSVSKRIPQECHYNPEHHQKEAIQEEQKKIKINRACTSYKDYLQLFAQTKGQYCESCGVEYNLVKRTYRRKQQAYDLINRKTIYADTG
jgi:hypothetical protein